MFKFKQHILFGINSHSYPQPLQRECASRRRASVGEAAVGGNLRLGTGAGGQERQAAQDLLAGETVLTGVRLQILVKRSDH